MDEDYSSQTEMSEFRWQRKWQISQFAHARYYGWEGSLNEVKCKLTGTQALFFAISVSELMPQAQKQKTHS